MKRVTAIALGCACLAGSFMTGVNQVKASDVMETHYGFVSDFSGGFDIEMKYEYSDGDWCEIYYYNTTVAYESEGVKFIHNRGPMHTDDVAREYWNVAYNDFHIGVIEVYSYLDEYGVVDDYLNHSDDEW